MIASPRACSTNVERIDNGLVSHWPRDNRPTMICDRVHCSILYEAVEGSLTVLAKIHVLMLIPTHIILLLTDLSTWFSPKVSHYLLDCPSL